MIKINWFIKKTAQGSGFHRDHRWAVCFKCDEFDNGSVYVWKKSTSYRQAREVLRYIRNEPITPAGLESNINFRLRQNLPVRL